MNISFYYQIDYIDDAGLANYIDTFPKEEFEKAKDHYRILSGALSCIKGTNRDIQYVLDLYAFIQDDKGDAIDDTDILVANVLPNKEINYDRL